MQLLVITARNGRWAGGIALTALSLLSGLLSGCKREPSFEERYTAANQEIVKRAKVIDTQVVSTAAPVMDEKAEADFEY